MGWLNIESDHEGFIVAIDPEDRTRELGLADSERVIRRIDHVRVGCDCGWRSATLVAPVGAWWMPCTPVFSVCDEERVNEIAHEIWRREHIAHVDDRATFALLDGLRRQPLIGGRR